MNVSNIAYTISIWTLPVLFAVTLHEAAHGWMASKLGDQTARMMGRVTFNPLRHIDPMGTVVLPLLLLLASGGRMMFGFAKPVPVNFRALGKPRRDMVLVAIAGPGINIIMAIVAAAAFHLLPYLNGTFQDWVGHNLDAAVWINLLLAVFNMIPIPPLDGGRVAVGVLPRSLAMPLARLERAGIVIILGVVFLLPWIGDLAGLNLDVFWWIVGEPATLLRGMVFHMVGVL